MAYENDKPLTNGPLCLVQGTWLKVIVLTEIIDKVFKVNKNRNRKLLLAEGEWDEVLGLPVVESSTSSQVDPVVKVTISIKVFKSINLIVTNMERWFPYASTSNLFLSLGGETQPKLV